MARTGAEIYRNFQDGPGAGGLADAAAVIKAIADECAEDADAVRRLTAKMEAGWQGEAAGAARRGAAPLDTEHQSAATGLSDVEMVTTAEVDFFGSAKSSVVPVPPRPAEPSSWAGFVDLAEQYKSYENKLDDHNAAAKHNVAVMDGYASDSASVSQQLPQEYGSLSSGPADVSVRREVSIDVDDGSVSATEWKRAGESTPDDATPGAAVPGDAAPGADARQPDGRPSPGGAPTSPGSYMPTSPGPVLPVGDVSPRPTPVSPGFGLVVPWAGTDGGRNEFGGRGGTGGRGGSVGAAPREGAPPRDGLREGTPRGGVSEPHGARSGAAMIGGRGGATPHGVPLGAAGRGRDDEDREHQRLAFLEGDDPEELFGSEILTAPATIGAEDED